jgi:hypothetical protein
MPNVSLQARMTIEEAIVARIQSLVEEGHVLAVGDKEYGSATEPQRQRCAGWLISATNVVHRLCESPENPYRKHADAIASLNHGYIINNAVGEMTSVLANLLSDAQAGLISSITGRARAEIFDDFLDHADAYATDNRKNGAGVISGVVFEDTIRRLCRNRSIPEKDVKLDALISALVKAGDLSDVKAKRARVAAHVRTKASHAQWSEFEMGDVSATIAVTRELIASKLDP